MVLGRELRERGLRDLVVKVLVEEHPEGAGLSHALERLNTTLAAAGVSGTADGRVPSHEPSRKRHVRVFTRPRSTPLPRIYPPKMESDSLYAHAAPHCAAAQRRAAAPSTP